MYRYQSEVEKTMNELLRLQGENATLYRNCTRFEKAAQAWQRNYMEALDRMKKMEEFMYKHFGYKYDDSSD